MDKRIYLDNASTSFPKAPGVADAMRFFTEEMGCNINRGGYSSAYAAAETVIETRERLCRLFGFPDSKNVIFTANVTQSLNMILKGLLRPGDHVLVTSMEHNALMRPLVQLEKQGVTFSRIPCDKTGALLTDQIEPLIRPETKAIAMLHASNVCGAVMHASEVGMLAKQRGLYFILDAAQTAGLFDIDMIKMNISALAFTGHKSLLGPQGIGGFIVTDELALQMTPLLSGGTGSLSDSEETPSFLPDRFEAGTMNLPGVYGLHAALDYLERTGIDVIRERELALARRLHRALADIPGTRMVGPGDWSCRAPIVSADFPDHDNAIISHRLGEEYNILTRCGLHCAPSAHKTLGTFPQGTVRFSPSHRTSEDEIDYCAEAVAKIVASGSD